jgi:hypothetical protein
MNYLPDYYDLIDDDKRDNEFQTSKQSQRDSKGIKRSNSNKPITNDRISQFLTRQIRIRNAVKGYYWNRSEIVIFFKNRVKRLQLMFSLFYQS